EKVLPGGLISVGNARIQDPRLHVDAVAENVECHNGAAVAVGRGAANIAVNAEGEWRADEVSGLVKALGPVNIIKAILPCDNEAAGGKGSHVAVELTALLIEDVDENFALDDGAVGRIARGADALAVRITGLVRPSHDKPAVSQSSNVRDGLICGITSADYG